MTRKRTGLSRKPDERGRSSREALIERICRAASEGLSLHAAAVRERVSAQTMKSWLAEDETFRARYEKARAIGRTFILDDVLALADSLPGTGRADIRLKLAARKWWAAEVWKTSRPETPAQTKARIEAEKQQRQEEERAAELEAHWERVLAIEAEDERRKAEDETQPHTSETIAIAPKLEPAAAESVASPEPAAPAAAKVPTPAPAPIPKPQLVRSLYDLSALPPPKSHTEVKTMRDWDALNWRSY